MEIACLDLEGVLIPEIWIAFAEKTGIEALKRTTRDEPDYDVLMRYRLDILEKNGLGEWHLRNMENDELVSLQQTLDIMLKHFEEDEDFEKCIVIKKELDKVTDTVKLDI